MHKIDTPNATNDNKFQDDIENVQVGTELDEDWLNAVQEEMLAPIVDAGLTPTKGTNNQLLQAIVLLAKKNGGSGGGAVNFEEPEGNSPVSRTEKGMKIYSFENTNQMLFLPIAVPKNYETGTQMQMKLACFVDDTANYFTMGAKTYLVKTGTDAFDSESNFYNPTPANNTLDAPAKKLRVITLNLTDANGQINGQDLAPNDLLKIEISRSADTTSKAVEIIPQMTSIGVV